jgi:hypothetical protein
MPDLLIRGVDRRTIEHYDALAAQRGISRNELLASELNTAAAPQERRKITQDDLRRCRAAFIDLDNPEIMAGAWA